jgi:tellurite resistance protein TerC
VFASGSLPASNSSIYDKKPALWFIIKTDQMDTIFRIFISRLTVRTLAQAKRVIRIVLGFTLLLIGIALIVLPGPATVVIPVALALLAGEFVWAKRLLEKFNSGVHTLWRKRKGKKR